MDNGEDMDNESHTGQHYNCPPCFKIKCESIQFQGLEAQQRRDKDSSLEKDLGAYKSMRRQGIQPQHVFGSYEVQQQAETKFEAEHQTIMSPELRKEFSSRLPDGAAK